MFKSEKDLPDVLLKIYLLFDNEIKNESYGHFNFFLKREQHTTSQVLSTTPSLWLLHEFIRSSIAAAFSCASFKSSLNSSCLSIAVSVRLKRSFNFCSTFLHSSFSCSKRLSRTPFSLSETHISRPCRLVSARFPSLELSSRNSS